MKYCITINDNRYEVVVDKMNATIVYSNEIALDTIKSKDLVKEPISVTTLAPKSARLSEQDYNKNSADEKAVIKAPMAGEVTDIKVVVGSNVKKGDTILLLEAMKMENEITTHTNGIVAEINVTNGSNVFANDVLVILK